MPAGSTRRPAAAGNVMLSASFGEIKMIPAKQKSYCLYWDKDLAKWPLLFEITEKHTENQAIACKLLMEAAQVKGLTTQKIMDTRLEYIEKANTIRAIWARRTLS